MTLADLRRNYTLAGLRESDLDADPIRQFQKWFREAHDSGVPEPNAMTLATVSAEGFPSARIVLLKGVEERGFTFFTNYDSRKGREMEASPRAALVCYWADLERQVRIEGPVAKVTDAESDEYHRSRPRGSQFGAWCSSQSEVISGREVLEQRLAELQLKFGDGEIPRPPHWGGYRLSPTAVEFWQGRPNRLHDRLSYRKLETGAWIWERLSP